MSLTIALLEHRIEFLQEFYNISKNYDIIVLEEPDISISTIMEKDDIDIEFIIDYLYSEFSEYMKEQYNLVKNLIRDHRKVIIQVEPYLTSLVDMFHFIEFKIINKVLEKDNEIKFVHGVESIVSKYLVEYYESILSKSFEDVILNVIKFAKYDAFRILIRDLMRAWKMRDVVNEYGRDKHYLVEAGTIHTCLSKFMSTICNVSVHVIDVKEVIARRLNIVFPQHPGNILTRIFLEARPFNLDYCKLLAARSIVYTLLITKSELRPSNMLKYPHIVDEYRVLDFVNKLSYDDCRRIYEKYRSYIGVA
ncbi:MAG: hypothetical protein GXO23_01515 [Crenarchaeota archaeon]|nr:hypothetical protein [Thermoproteota archaeon]